MSYDKMNRYWLPNVEINKKVITQELQFYLGPDAHVRPYTRDVSSTISNISIKILTIRPGRGRLFNHDSRSVPDRCMHQAIDLTTKSILLYGD
jgi:hypothetical protein